LCLFVATKVVFCSKSFESMTTNRARRDSLRHEISEKPPGDLS
jgi:hypothetical protein